METQSPIILPAGAKSSSPSPDLTCWSKDAQAHLQMGTINEDKKRENRRRECYELQRLSAVIPSDEETDSAQSPAKGSATPIL